MASSSASAHDIGKLRVPEDIIDKPGSLTREERAFVMRHSYDTGQILKRAFPDQPVAQWAAMHHENLLCTGYPYHCQASAIPRAHRQGAGHGKRRGPAARRGVWIATLSSCCARNSTGVMPWRLSSLRQWKPPRNTSPPGNCQLSGAAGLCHGPPGLLSSRPRCRASRV